MTDPDDIDDAAETDDATDPSETDGLFAKIKGWVRRDREHSSEWRKEAKEDYEFVAGHQWSEDDKQALRDQLRPEITFNRIQPTIESVVGLEIGNRREVQYIPRELGDAKANEILTAAGQWVRDETEAEDEESDAFFDTVVCGMGWTDTRMDYEEDPEGKVLIEACDPLEMYSDADARKRNLVDARRIARIRTMPIEEARDLLAEYDYEEEDIDAAWARDEEKPEDHNADPQWAYKQDTGEREKPGKQVTLVHIQWWEKEPYHRVSFNGRIEEVSTGDFPKFKERATKLETAGLTMGPMKSVKMTRRVYKQAWVGAKVLYTGNAPCEGHFSWQCITGKRDKTKGTWYGLVRSMKDPQRWANKWLSQSLHILNSNAKGGIFAEKDAFENQRQAEDTYSRPDAITWTKSGAIQGQKIQPKPQPTFPAGFDNLMQFAIQSIRDVSGVNLELLGLKDAQQAGVLEQQRKQAGMTILAMLFDSLRRYRKRQGRVMLYFITNYLSDGRLIRIVGEESKQYVPLLKQPGVVEYDVIVDDAPTSPNQKEQVWDTITSLLPALGPMLGPDEWLALAKYSPLPTSVVEKLQEAQKAKQEAQQPKQQQAEQMAVEAHQAQVEGLRAKAAQDTAGAHLKEMQAAELMQPTGAPSDPMSAVSAAAKAQADQARANQANANAVFLHIKAQKEAATPILYPQPSSGSSR